MKNKSLSVLAVIPARAGSKRVPQKNKRLLLGKPLLFYTIEAAQNSGVIDEIVVSTDDEEIAEIAKKAGVSVPFLRPAELAQDGSKTIDVVIHLIEWYKEKQNKEWDVILLLQPTSPLRTAKHIQEAWRLFLEKETDAVVSVCQVEHHPWWSNTLSADGNMKNFLSEEIINKRSQELPLFYRLNGAIYFAKAAILKEYRSFFIEKSFAYVMKRECSIDIDSELDFLVAECLLKTNQEKKHEK